MGSTAQRPYELGAGKYRARRVGDKIILHAIGDTPGPNYKVWLRKAGATDVADFELWWLLPAANGGIALATPFNVHVSFRAGLNPDLVRVRDLCGVHHVEVEPVFVAGVSALATGSWQYANQFDLHYQGKDIAYTQANVAGDPLLTYGPRYFYGEEIERLSAPIGELVSVTLELHGEAERLCMSLLLPRTWVPCYANATIEALVLETVVHASANGPAVGQQTIYERATRVTGEASFLFS